MSTAQKSLLSTPKWLVQFTSQFVGGFFIWAVTTLTLAGISLYLASRLLPSAIPFMLIAVVSYAVRFVGLESDGEVGEKISENIEEMTATETRLYIITLLLVIMAGVTVPVLAAGAAGVLIAQMLGAPVIAVIAAFIIPPLDAWVGKMINYNLGGTGAMLVLAVMIGLAKVYHISPEIPGKAGNYARPVFS